LIEKSPADQEYSDPGFDDPDDPSSGPNLLARVQLCPRKLSQYAAEIFTTAMNDPFCMSISSSHFFSTQTELTPRMREVAIRWMIQAQARLQITSDSLYNAVTYFDIACCSRAIAKSVLQLLVITCLWVSAKVEERRITIQDFLNLSANQFTREEVLECELGLIQTLEFRTNFPARKLFLRRILDAVDANASTIEASNFACEMSLLPIEMMGFQVQVAAAASVCVAFVGVGVELPLQELQIQLVHWRGIVWRSVLPFWWIRLDWGMLSLSDIPPLHC
jgi:hypothetical protein